MKAIRIERHGAADVLELIDMEVPVPRAGEILVRNAVIGVNYVDVQHREGKPYPVNLPLIPGIEGAGMVEAVGSDVSEFRPQDRVAYAGYMGGDYADYTIVPQDRLVPVPDSISFEQAGGGLLQGLTAYILTHQVYRVREGDWVLVHAAAGGVGLLLTQCARLLGATVIATVSNAAKAEAARAAGAAHTILYTERDFEAETLDITAHQGVHVVYDAVGKTTFEKSLRVLRKRGHMVIYGQSSGAPPLLDVNRLSGITENSFSGSLSLTWAAVSHYTEERGELLACAEVVFDLMAANRLNIRIAERLPLHRAADAHRLLESRQMAGKVLLLP